MVTSECLEDQLRRELNGLTRLVILGMGNELRSDDGLGLVIARRLKPALRKVPGASVIVAGSSPENFTGLVSRLSPSHILLIDAACWGGEAGEAKLVATEAEMEKIPSTHSLPLSMLVSYLKEETGARVLVLGVQPRQLSFSVSEASLSEEVARAIPGLVKLLVKLIGEAFSVAERIVARVR